MFFKWWRIVVVIVVGYWCYKKELIFILVTSSHKDNISFVFFICFIFVYYNDSAISVQFFDADNLLKLLSPITLWLFVHTLRKLFQEVIELFSLGMFSRWTDSPDFGGCIPFFGIEIDLYKWNDLFYTLFWVYAALDFDLIK